MKLTIAAADMDSRRACPPADTTWLFWWSPLLSTNAVVVLAWLHHMAATHPDRDVTVEDIGKQCAIKPSAAALALVVLGRARLVFQQNGALRLVSPIPLPNVSSAPRQLPNPESETP